MKPSITRWTTLTGAALVALPLTCFAQAQPPDTPPAAQTTQSAQPAAPPATEDAAKAHLTAARNILSQLTQLPAAAQLQGDARAQVSQLINNFNELITTQTNWKGSYAKVEANLESLIGPSAQADASRPTGTPGAVGTSGATAPAAIDPALRAKLSEFRAELDEFEKAALNATPSPTPEAPAMTSTSSTSSTSSLNATSTEATSATPAAPATPSTPPAAAAAPDPEPQTESAAPLDSEEILHHVQAIEAILGANVEAQAAAQSAAGQVGTATTPSGSTRTTITPSDVTLNQSQLTELKTHLAEMRRLLERK